MYCENCSLKLEEHSKFCDKCGARVTPLSENSTGMMTWVPKSRVNPNEKEWIFDFKVRIDRAISDIWMWENGGSGGCGDGGDFG